MEAAWGPSRAELIPAKPIRAGRNFFGPNRAPQSPARIRSDRLGLVHSRKNRSSDTADPNVLNQNSISLLPSHPDKLASVKQAVLSRSSVMFYLDISTFFPSVQHGMH